MLEKEMLSKKTWAVIGVTQDPDKYANMIYRRLRKMGFQVYAVNPKYEEAEGDRCYASLRDLPVIPEVINMVVSPKRGGDYLKEASELGIRYVWFQPGTEDASTDELSAELGLEYVKSCVLVVTGWFDPGHNQFPGQGLV
ncbi:MAG: CoA-binding protein [Oscillospiraceae bacterium]|nr:CoA-binding protein [Oscillospiraceae bacterium]